jgi:nitrate reductase NapE
MIDQQSNFPAGHQAWCDPVATESAVIKTFETETHVDRPPGTKSQELRGFLLLTAVLAPALAIAVVTGYGFLVWMYQLFAGPPGPRF